MGPTDDRLEPKPRAEKRDSQRWHSVSIERIALPIGGSPARSFVEVLDGRRTIRKLRMATRERIASLLWHGARARETDVRSDGLPWQHRASPSAGGLHPIELFVLLPEPALIARYDPIFHTLDVLGGVDAATLERGRSRLRSVVPDADGAYLVLAADVCKTDAAYESAVSLFWRDAGALLATLQFTATALDLGFCCLGLLGHDVVASLPGAAMLDAVGSAVVGEHS